MYGQQNPNWGISELIGRINKRNEERGQAKDFVSMMNDTSQFGQKLGNLNYGGETTAPGLLPKSQMGQQARQGFFPTNFAQPSADTLGQGLLGQPRPTTNQQQGFFTNAPVDVQKAVTSEPKTLAQQTNIIKAQIGPTMKYLMDDYKKQGRNVDPRQLYQMLQQASNEKIAEHTANYNQQQIETLSNGFNTSQNPNEKAMYAARLKQLGIDVTGAAKQFMVSAGDQFKQENANTRNKENNDTKIKTTGMNNNTSITTTGMNNDTSRYGVDKRLEGTIYTSNNRPIGTGRTSTTKPSKAESWALNYESGVGLSNDNSTIDTLSNLDNPTPSQQNQLQQALGRRDHYWKVSSGGQYGQAAPQEQQAESNPGGAEWYYKQAEEIKANNPGATMEEIEAFMSDKINRR